MNRIIREKNTNYTTISNVFLKDNKLSLKAKGLLAIIMSLPEDWDFSINGIVAVIKEGRESTSSTIKELINAGYCTREQCKGDKGRFKGYDYTFYEEPKAGTPLTDCPESENPLTDNPTQLNTNLINPLSNKGVSENKFSLPNSPLLENFKSILENFKGCSRITIQLTAENAETLFKEYTQEQIIEGLEIIENSNKALKNKSLYLTLRKILKNNFGGGAEFQKGHEQFKEVYKKWYFELVGEKPKISKNANAASIELFKHLIDASVAKTEEAAIKNFEYILSNWDKVEEFLRRQTDITQINRNINNIRNQIKNGASKSNFQAANNSQQTSSQRKEY